MPLNYRVILAFVGVVIIWSTTPLAISWSTQAAGFVFALASRMMIGLSLLLLLMMLWHRPLQWNPQAIRAYFYAGLGMYSSMMAVYWSAQYIPSGWIAMLFGLTPIYSAVMANIWLSGERLTSYRMLGILISLLGLVVVLYSSLQWGEQAQWGVLGVLLSGFLHSLSAVWVKRVNACVPASSMTAGSLLCATPLFLLSWLWIDGDLNASLQLLEAAPLHSLMAILYLAIFGSIIGFLLYFYVLQHVQATRTAFISLLTPVVSLLLGNTFNHEAININIISGGLLILGGLAFFEFAEGFFNKKVQPRSCK